MNETAVLACLTLLSLILCLLPFIVLPLKAVYNRFTREGRTYSWSKRLVAVTGCVIFSLFFLQLAVAYYENTEETGTAFELVCGSFFGALQAVSVNTNYQASILAAKEMFSQALSFTGGWLTAAGVYTALLNLAAPIVGGAVLFDVLTSVFPKLRLQLAFFKKLFIFSELNERSLELAKSLRRDPSVSGAFFKPLLVFTDSYASSDDEASSELLQKARALGAVCVKDDITHVHPQSLRKRVYFLLDDEEIGNLEALAELSSDERRFWLKHSDVYVFYRDNSYDLIEKGIEVNLEKEYDQKYSLSSRNPEEAEKLRQKVFPLVRQVKYQESMIYDLLERVPLYQPLLNRPGARQTLNLTIFGAGSVGIQMLLSASWCGQIYGCTLCVNVVSQESVEDFLRRLNALNPELVQSADPQSGLLRIYPDGEEKNAPYFVLRYAQADVGEADFSTLRARSVHDAGDEFSLLESDYVLAALGSDQKNIAAAEKLEREITRAQERLAPEERKEIVITFVVYNRYLCGVLDEKSVRMSSRIRMEAIGNISTLFSWRNITMDKWESGAAETHRQYLAAQRKKAYSDSEKQRSKSYYVRSSRAHEIHLRYRAYSAFRIRDEQCPDLNRTPLLNAFTKERCDEYLKLLNEDERLSVLVQKHLSWLEHRRWTAFMRAIGYRHKESLQKGDDDENLRLHPCIAESANDAASDSPYRMDFLDMAALVRLGPNASLDPKARKEELRGVYKAYDNPANQGDLNDRKIAQKIFPQPEKHR